VPFTDPEKRREFHRKWRTANRDKIREASQKWRTAHLDQVRQKNRAWREANREKVRAQQRKYQAAKRARSKERDSDATGWRSTGLPEPHIVGMIPDMKNHPTDYRLSAGQCRRRADAAVDEVRKATWLTFADEWMKLAYEAELSASRDPPKQPAGVPNAEVL
jgi:hypothetical protein